MGISRPRLSALRRIPAHAVALKEYFGAGEVSKTCDNEHTFATLGDAEELSVKHPVGPPIPELFQPVKDDGKVASFVRRKQAGDIFRDNPRRSKESNKAAERKPEPAPLASESSAGASQADVLTRESSAENSGIPEEGEESFPFFIVEKLSIATRANPAVNARDGAHVVNTERGEMLPENLAARGIKLDLENDAEARALETEVEASDT